MSTSFNIKFVFDRKESESLNKMLAWISEHSHSYDNARIKFNETQSFKEFNFGPTEEFDFSKGVPYCSFTVSFMVEKSDELINKLIEELKYTLEEVNKNEKNCHPGHLCLGYFYLEILYEKNELVLDFKASVFNLGNLFMEYNATRKIMLDFCKKFNPKEAYIEIEDEKDEVFWPLKNRKR